METEYRALVSMAAEQAKALAVELANNGRFEPLYLYCRPSKPGHAGCLWFVPDSEEPPAGFHLVTGEGLRGNVPYVAYWGWIYERARRAPILAV